MTIYNRSSMLSWDKTFISEARGAVHHSIVHNFIGGRHISHTLCDLGIVHCHAVVVWRGLDRSETDAVTNPFDGLRGNDPTTETSCGFVPPCGRKQQSDFHLHKFVVEPNLRLVRCRANALVAVKHERGDGNGNADREIVGVVPLRQSRIMSA